MLFAKRMKYKSSVTERFDIDTSCCLSQRPFQLKIYESDIAVERNTYQQSRSGLDEMLGALKKQVETEQALREEVEIEMDRVRAQKAAVGLPLRASLVILSEG